MYERIRLDYPLTPCTKINSTYFKDLSVGCGTIKLLEENLSDKLLDTGLGGDFFETDTKTRATKAKQNKQDYIKLKNFCTAKQTINRMKRQLTNVDISSIK